MPNFRISAKSLGNFRGKLREKLEKAKELKQYPKFTIREPKHLIILPLAKSAPKTDVKYPLLEAFASAHIIWDPRKRQLVYNVLEFELLKGEKEMLDSIKSHLLELIDIKISVVKRSEDAMEYLERKVSMVLDDLGIELSHERYVRLIYYIHRDFVGLNQIEPFMHDPYIEDIGCSGMDTMIYVTHRKYGSMVTNIGFDDFEELSNFVIKLSERCGRYISYATPLLDGTLPDGSRVQASLAKDVTTKGPTFSIRRFRRNPFSTVDIVNFNTASTEIMAYLWFLIDHDASIMVAGGVATGKTTFLNALSMFIAPEKKIVSIEDVREINISHDNWIPATSRTGFGVPEGGRRYGEVELFDLLKESFRMKPDYVIVGEVRGKEAYVLFQGMASGNPSLGTIHAGSVEDMMKRLETPPIELSPSLIESLDAVIIMVHAKEKGSSSRRVKEVVEIESMDPHTGKAHTTKTFAWIPSADMFKDESKQSLLVRKIAFERGIPFEKAMKDIEDRRRVLEWMKKFNIVQFEEVCALLNLYHKDPKTIREWVEKDTPPYKTKSKESLRKLWESSTGLRIMPGSGS